MASVKEKLKKALEKWNFWTALLSLVHSLIIFFVVASVKTYLFLYNHRTEIIVGVIASIVATLIIPFFREGFIQ